MIIESINTLAPSDPPTKPIGHVALVIANWKALKSIGNSERVELDGDSLTIAHVTAVAAGKCRSTLAGPVTEGDKIETSVRILQDKLRRGETIYGVNTGYGGSADVRCETQDMRTLQRAFLQHLHCGVTLSDSMREEWVRAAMLIRANTVSRGHSAVRRTTITMLLDCLNANIIPIIPTRGSISASGDLTPLSYIAGLLEGNPDILCKVGDEKSHNRSLLPADQALELIHVDRPVTFEPKEALGLVNGTAVSCAVGSLALKSMHHLLVLSQLITAMNVEALSGTTASFAPFISKVRPHPGQNQVAVTILTALKGSELATDGMEEEAHTLFQDRYSLRTVPQWLGPFVEDLLLAHEQITTELNSTTDNPLIDPETGRMHHGGNFQAVSVTSAMEKCRLAAQAIGRMLFAQFTELCNPSTNRGLPPNLCADDPSTSFTMKGLDVHMAGYMSELAFLANPVHNHVVSAEMGNQALNSLALISARYTEQSVEILTLMSASAIYGACQALDLRAIIRSLVSPLQDQILSLLKKFFGEPINEQDFLDNASSKIWHYVKSELTKTTTLDAKERFETIFQGARSPMLEALESVGRVDLATELIAWSKENAEGAETLYRQARGFLLSNHDGPGHLCGQGSRRLYEYVRNELRVPFHQGVQDHPAPVLPVEPPGNGKESVLSQSNEPDVTNGKQQQKRTIGHWVSIIYQAIKSDDIMPTVIECLEDGLQEKGLRQEC